jgi:uncharacterized membrane protein (UPF0127 family)
MKVVAPTRRQAVLDGCLIGVEVIVANTWLSRAIGLLTTSYLPQGQGLLITPCAAVHTIGMRYSIDVIYISRAGTIVKVVHGLQSWRLSSCASSYSTVELASGEAKRLSIEAGRSLEFAECGPVAAAEILGNKEVTALHANETSFGVKDLQRSVYLGPAGSTH